MIKITVTRKKQWFTMSQASGWRVYNNGNLVGKVHNGQTVQIELQGSMGLIHVEVGRARSNYVLVSADDEDVVITISSWICGLAPFFFIFLIPWTANAIDIKKETVQKL